MIIQDLTKRKLINPPSFVGTNTHYLAISGSRAYGCNREDSDYDYVGFAIPPKDMIFPHLRGEILDFGSQKQRFNVWQKHHIIDPNDNREIGFAVYNIVTFFENLRRASPDKIDALFVPDNCVVHITSIGQRVREKRHLFLTKKCFWSFKGYAHSQLKKVRTKTPKEGSKRHKDVQKHGIDTKFCYHIVRLLGEVEQILEEGDLDLQRNREVLKEIRRGEWPVEKFEEYFEDREAALQKKYDESSLPYGPDEERMKELLSECLEIHYGSLDKCVVRQDAAIMALREIQEIVERLNHGHENY